MSLNEEIINNVYKNAHIALQSISNVLDACSDEEMKAELLDEYDGYEKMIGEISKFMSENKIEPKDNNFMKKAMLFTSIKMNTLCDDSKSHIADMMLKGTVMGISELKQILSRSDEDVDERILDYAQRLCDLEEGYEQRLKQLL
ncbi:MAG: hypothetical protein ACI4M6_05175 [Christensenellaceae bacterium]